MKSMKIVVLALLFGLTFANASWQDSLGGVLEGIKKPTLEKSSSDISTYDMNSALKQALSVGVNYAVKSLGKKNGYLNNPLTKIELPSSLATASKLLKSAGGEKYIDDLVLSLNSAATEAAPQTAKIFADSITNMSISDAKKILSSKEEAATEYFKKTTTTQLRQMIMPIVKKSMSNNSVATYYQAFQSFYKTNSGFIKDSEIGSLANSFGLGEYLPNQKDEDLDSYVTNRAIDGLMVMIAQKEKEIRANPMMQSSGLIQKVFSSF